MIHRVAIIILVFLASDFSTLHPCTSFALADPPSTRFGDPLPGLTAEQLRLFHLGREGFEAEESDSDGIGPVFNARSCVACHDLPQSGGGSQILSTRFGTINEGRYDSLVDLGGPTIQTQGAQGVDGFQFVGEVIPDEATIVARRRANPLFGLGLVDSVPDLSFYFEAFLQSILSPETAGRPNVVLDLRSAEWTVGRFGWKAGIGSLFDFAADAYKDEMGITVPGSIRDEDGRLVSQENAPQGDIPQLAFNLVESPNESDDLDIVGFNDFMTLLAPPPTQAMSGQARQGKEIFRQIGCADCHQPTMRTGRNAIAALDRVAFQPYSDFLLHNMGALGDGLEQGWARGNEMRTAPLWGLKELPFYLHDGRAETVDEAIRMHDGQGRRSKVRFENLPNVKRSALLDFLDRL